MQSAPPRATPSPAAGLSRPARRVNTRPPPPPACRESVHCAAPAARQGHAGPNRRGRFPLTRDAPPDGRIIRADARDLCRHVRPGSVDLTVTSPPYRNAIDYRQHVANQKSRDKKWMRGTGTSTTAAYLDDMEAIFGQVLEATRPGGFCAIVIGDEVVNGKTIPLSSLIASRMASTENDDDPAKWRLRDTIVWHKTTSGRNGAGNRCGVFIKYRRPGYFRANIMHECILVLQKEGQAQRAAAADRGEQIPLNRVVKREIANSIWHIAPVPPNMVDHPVPFPEQIPWRLVTLLTKKGDLVLDPMNGSGQTTKVARNLGRRYVGLDIEPAYVALAKRRLRGRLQLSDYLIPVFHKEAWHDGGQSGFFETETADMSANVPPGYRLEFGRGSDGEVRGGSGGMRAYYRDESGSYMCFILAASGRQTRLRLGRPGEDGSMLHGALLGLPDGPFALADLAALLGGRPGGGRQPARACMDVLLHSGLAAELGGNRRRYELTDAGRRQRARLARG